MKTMHVFLAAVLVFGMATGLGAQAKSVSFVTDQGKDGGYVMAIVKAALQKAGYEMKVQYLPAARALASVMDGSSEALLGFYINEERATKMLYTDPVATSELVFFKLKDSKATYSGKLEDLTPYKIGTINGASYSPEFDSATFFKKEPASDVLTNIRKLLAGRVDLILDKRGEINADLAAQFPADAPNVVALDPPLKVAKFYCAFAKNSKAFPDYEKKVADFNAGLAAIIKDGTVKKILDQKLHE